MSCQDCVVMIAGRALDATGWTLLLALSCWGIGLFACAAQFISGRVRKTAGTATATPPPTRRSTEVELARQALRIAALRTR
jgi:hypothetical protein